MKYSGPKVAVIGTGNVGATFAFSLINSSLAREIVLIDIDEKRARGEIMDLNHCAAFIPPVNIYSSGYEGCKDADIVIITAGAKMKPGQSRLDLIKENYEIFKIMIPGIMKHLKNGILLIVSNPVDILTYITLKISGLPAARVIGSGTVLDTSRFRYLISSHCSVDPRNVHAYIIGEHGDTELPVWNNANIGGIPIEKYCPDCSKYCKCNSKEALGNIFNEVKNSAYKIIASKGATYYAIALSLVRITEAIIRDENSILPVSTLITGYYGINNVCLSIPSVVNRNGVVRILKIKLTSREQNQLKHSANTLRNIIKKIF